MDSRARPLSSAAIALAVAVLIAGCSSSPAQSPAISTAPAVSGTSAAPDASTAPSPDASTAPSLPSQAASPIESAAFDADAATLRTLSASGTDDTKLVLGEELAGGDGYTSHAVTYTSEGLAISGVLHEPLTPGPHPAVVLVHGFVDPSQYTSGSELQREQEHLAREGYVVFYTDLRGLAGSDAAPAGPPDLEMGMTADVIAAVEGLRASGLPSLDAKRIGLLGHSLGGLLVINVLAAKPGLVDAAVAFAPSGTDLFANVEHFLSPGDPFYEELIAAHGTPETNPQYWADVSPRTFVENVDDPLLIVHGAADSVNPFEWSTETAAVWQAAGKDLELVSLAGEDHVFEDRWHDAIDSATAFFDEHLE